MLETLEVFMAYSASSIFFFLDPSPDTQDGDLDDSVDGLYSGADVVVLYNIVNTSANTNTLYIVTYR